MQKRAVEQELVCP